jgi:hypothetical protein
LIVVELDRPQAVYCPGETLSFQWRVNRVPSEQVDRLEVSVLWFTEGKGDEDISVHSFWEIPAEQLRESLDAEPPSLATELPASPFSYEGRLLRIRWCIRLRLFLTNGEDIVMQQPFYLGPLTNEV